MRTVFKAGFIVAGVGLVAVIAAANFVRNPELFHFKWKLKREVPIQVNLDPVTRRTVVQTIEAPGEVEADVEVEISAQVLARIIDLPVREGQTVKEGDLLVRLDSVNIEADVRSAEARVQRLKASIEQTQAEIEKAQRDLDRSKGLFQKRAVTHTELADYETELVKQQAQLAINKAELVEAEATLVKAKDDLLDCTIRSPIDGIVSQLIAEEGEVVVVGTMNNAGTVIMEVARPEDHGGAGID